MFTMSTVQVEILPGQDYPSNKSTLTRESLGTPLGSTLTGISKCSFQGSNLDIVLGDIMRPNLL